MNVLSTQVDGPIRFRIGFMGLKLESSDGTGGVILVGTTARALRLHKEDMLTVAEVAQITRVFEARVECWIRRQRCIFVEGPDETLRLPAWQFITPMWDAMPKVFEVLGTTDGWEVLSFLETPTDLLGGRTARNAIEQGKLAEVLELVRDGD
jgi:hypothetical protein